MLRFQAVNFEYETGSETQFQSLSFHAPYGWTGVVGANGCGKTTLLKLAAGLLSPSEGLIERPPGALYCPQRTDDPPPEWSGFINSNSKSAILIQDRLGIDTDWRDRWPTLSHGERKRGQIGTALWQEPELLAIDEPTNHVDAAAREAIMDALQGYQGIGLLVSHDRRLLDTLCTQCLFVDPPDVTLRPGGYTKGATVGDSEQKAVQKALAVKKQAYRKVKKEMSRRRELADLHNRQRSKKNISRKDHDAKEKIDHGRITGKDAVGGKLKNQLTGRLEQARKETEGFKVKKDYVSGIWLPESVSRRQFLLELKEGTLSMGSDKVLYHPDLHIAPTDRIGLAGPNGAGKSTLIRNLIGAFNLPIEKITYLPQEIDLQTSRSILEDARRLPGQQLGHLMNIVSRLGSRPRRLLDSDQPSPGEIRKLMLALGMVRAPHMIVMDEPTNHMDLPSIECLEQALTECPCGLLLVSHDQTFLDKLTLIHWHIVLDGGSGREEGRKDNRERDKETFTLQVLS